MDINLYSMECFVVVARYLNYTKAAEVLNISQPALSKNIRALEQSIGVTLLTRNTRKVALTQAGKFFYQQTLHIMNDLDRAVASTREIDEGLEGLLRVGFLPYPYSEMIPKVLKNFHMSYPTVRLDVTDGEEFMIEKMLKDDELDIAMLSDWGTDFSDEYVCEPIYSDEYCAVISREHPLAMKDSIDFEELRNEKFLVLNQKDHLIHDCGTNNVIELCKENGFYPNIDTKNQAKTLLGLCVLAGGNQGVAILASHMEKFVLEDYNVKFLSIKDMDLSFNACAYYRKDNKNSCIESFLNVMRNS